MKDKSTDRFSDLISYEAVKPTQMPVTFSSSESSNIERTVTTGRESGTLLVRVTTRSSQPKTSTNK